MSSEILTFKTAHTNTPGQARLPKIGSVRLGTRDVKGRRQECGHFILDVADPLLSGKALAVYGNTPGVLDIRFFSDHEAFVWSFQRWGISKKRIPYLVCEGKDGEAIAHGQKRDCPCPSLGGDCRMVARMKFLIPQVSLGGYFLLVTKSKYSVEEIQTTLEIARRSVGSLIMRPFRLIRKEGYAEINNSKVKKYYISLQEGGLCTRCACRPALPAAVQDKADVNTGVIKAIGDILPSLILVEDDAEKAYREKKRIEEGRRMVRERFEVELSVTHMQRPLLKNMQPCALKRTLSKISTRVELLETLALY